MNEFLIKIDIIFYVNLIKILSNFFTKKFDNLLIIYLQFYNLVG